MLHAWRLSTGVTFLLAAGIAQSEHSEIICDHAIVGAGWAGTYAAWRLVIDSRSVRPADLCIVEATSRAGGRTQSRSNDQGLIVDVGAMRFSKGMHLPSDLILGPLGFNSACFEPSCSPDPTRNNATLHRVVGRDGENLGFGAPINKMIQQLSALGVRIIYNARMTAVVPAWKDGHALDSSTHPAETLVLKVTGAHTSSILARKVILNLPRNALLDLARDSVIYTHAPEGAKRAFEAIHCADNTAGKDEFAVKAYLSYPDAWWFTKLNLSQGRRENQSSPLVQVRYHGATGVKCVRNSASCYGNLEVVDDFELESPALAWYLQFQADKDEAFGRFNASFPATLELHSKVMDMHRDDLLNVGVNVSSIVPPTELLVGFWRADAVLQPCPHLLGPRLYPCMQGESPEVFLRKLRKPTESFDVFIANNDFWYTAVEHDGDWAQSSLISVEKLLKEYFDVPAPSWLNTQYYNNNVSSSALGQDLVV